MSNKSPTKPTSAIWNIGASASLLIATINLLSFIPAKCWIAPDIPTHKYSCGATFFPVWPIWRLLSANPLSTAALDAPMAAPRTSARGWIRASNCSLDLRPRPPDTTRVAATRSGRSDAVNSSEIHSVGEGAWGSTPSTISAEPSVASAGVKAVPRMVMSLMGSDDWTVRVALPAYIGRTKATT